MGDFLSIFHDIRMQQEQVEMHTGVQGTVMLRNQRVGSLLSATNHIALKRLWR